MLTITATLFRLFVVAAVGFRYSRRKGVGCGALREPEDRGFRRKTRTQRPSSSIRDGVAEDRRGPSVEGAVDRGRQVEAMEGRVAIVEQLVEKSVEMRPCRST